jgi:L-alanine-DL-glutamate epimerase-like enolase superfamily enzyme
MQHWNRLKALPLELEGYALEGLELPTNSGYHRHSTTISLIGSGERGLGEETTYRATNQAAFQERGAFLPLAGSYTLESFSARLDELDLHPDPPGLERYRDYRRWAFESAALDLALRQNRLSLAEALQREHAPVRFAVSFGLGSPATLEPVAERLAIHPDMRFKLDITPEWDEALCEEVAATGAVDVIDFKGAYQRAPGDAPPDVGMYRRVLEAFDEVIFEDPHATPEIDDLLADRADSISWDAPIHSVADIDALARVPRVINIKPSRFGTLERLLEAYEICEERGIRVYGGGQFELGVGREQVQLLASLFHPDAPNDVAPRGYHQLDTDEARPASPLEISPLGTGFGLSR